MLTITSLLLCLTVTAFGFPEGQIVGGKDAPVGKFPYQASLRQHGSHFCGGSIISNRYILTAAHCVEDERPSDITVHVGTNKLNSKGDTYAVDTIVIHRDYNPMAMVNDIALIRLNRNIQYSNLVGATKLASGSENYEGDSCVLSGWGTLKSGGHTPNNLQYITLLVTTQAKCNEVHSNIKKTHICTFTKYGQGACHGDSGGPLVANGVQIGIVSFGIPCGVGKPDVYTRVSSFRLWIIAQQRYLMSEGTLEQPADAIYIY